MMMLMAEAWRLGPEATQMLGEVGRDTRGHPNIFPNLWITGTQLCLRLPRGVGKTELWWFTLLAEDMPEKERKRRLSMANHVFGPAGLLEQDDGENWDQSTRGTRGPIGRKYPLNFQMNLGHGEVKKMESGASYIDSAVSEHAQLWTWRAWAEWMDADSWAALRQNHTRAPEDGDVV